MSEGCQSGYGSVRSKKDSIYGSSGLSYLSRTSSEHPASKSLSPLYRDPGGLPLVSDIVLESSLKPGKPQSLNSRDFVHVALIVTVYTRDISEKVYFFSSHYHDYYCH